MFIGEYSYTVDAKGRVVIPPVFRDNLKGRIYLVKGFERFLSVYDEHEWDIQQKSYAGLSEFGSNARNLKRLVFSGMSEVSPDKQGRIKIAPPLMDYSCIKKDVVIVGVDNHVEIWAVEEWKRFLDEYESNLGTLAEKLNGNTQDE